jgi:hypothetical protein
MGGSGETLSMILRQFERFCSKAGLASRHLLAKEHEGARDSRHDRLVRGVHDVETCEVRAIFLKRDAHCWQAAHAPPHVLSSVVSPTEPVIENPRLAGPSRWRADVASAPRFVAFTRSSCRELMLSRAAIRCVRRGGALPCLRSPLLRLARRRDARASLARLVLGRSLQRRVLGRRCLRPGGHEGR